MDRSRSSHRPYWECTQCNFSQWLVLGEGQAGLRRSSSNKPGRARSTRKFVTEAAAFDAVATQLAGDGAPPLQLNCTASWDYTTALATAAAAAEHQEMSIQLKQDLGIQWYPRSQPSLPVYPPVASTSRYAGSWSKVERTKSLEELTAAQEPCPEPKRISTEPILRPWPAVDQYRRRHRLAVDACSTLVEEIVEREKMIG